MKIASAAINALFLLTYLTNDVTAKDSQIHVKITPETDPKTLKNHIDKVKSLQPLFTLSEDRLRELTKGRSDLPDLTLWYRIVVELPSDAPEEEAKVKADLDTLDSVTDVVIPKTPPPPSLASATTPDLVGNQGYLGPNTFSNNGIDAEASWTYPGGNGAGVTIYDVEYNWSLTHEDLSATDGLELLLNPGDSANSPFDNGHGTAVLGEMVGDSNGLGVKGISYGASIGLAPEYTTQLGSARGNAILLAVDDAKAGDVILLEMQAWTCGPDYGPAEWEQDVFDATVVATANGITVVAAAGNGDVNLDSNACLQRFDRNFRDSGAIIVGAGTSGVVSNPREKLYYSSYGSRVDVHGWGYYVWTTGYGTGYNDPGNGSNQDKWYTSSFSGTSSASPFVAASVANIQGIAIQEFGVPLDPLEVRALLTDTGLPQQGAGGNIGPLVNLANAINSLFTPTSPTTDPPTQSPTVCTGEDLTVVLITDNYASETTWYVTNPDGQIVMNNDSLSNGQTYTTTECLNPGCNYEFVITDSFGDGICCRWGDGDLRISLAGTQIFASGGDFGSGTSHEFCVGGEPTCVDSGIPIFFDGLSVSCTLIGQQATACSNPIPASHCPLTCGACDEYECKDSTAPFGDQLNCDVLENADPDVVAQKCVEFYDELATTCRETCNFCNN